MKIIALTASVERSIKMLLVGDRVNMDYEGRRVIGTVSVIHENQRGEMVYWIDSDGGENCLVLDDSEIKIINCDYSLDFP